MIYQNSDKATYRLNYRDIDQNLTQGKGNGFENYVRLVAEKFNSKPRHVSNAMLAENLGIRNGTLDTILAHAQKDYGITINRRRSTEQINKESRLSAHAALALLFSFALLGTFQARFDPPLKEARL